MTRAEIQAQCLDLPEPDRAALAETLAESLDDASRIETLRSRLEKLEAAKMEILRQKLDAEMESWFEGESVEMTDETWDALMKEARERDRSDEVYGRAVPAEAQGLTRREYRESLKSS